MDEVLEARFFDLDNMESAQQIPFPSRLISEVALKVLIDKGLTEDRLPMARVMVGESLANVVGKNRRGQVMIDSPDGDVKIRTRGIKVEDHQEPETPLMVDGVAYPVHGRGENLMRLIGGQDCYERTESVDADGNIIVETCLLLRPSEIPRVALGKDQT